MVSATCFHVVVVVVVAVMEEGCQSSFPLEADPRMTLQLWEPSIDFPRWGQWYSLRTRIGDYCHVCVIYIGDIDWIFLSLICSCSSLTLGCILYIVVQAWCVFLAVAFSRPRLFLESPSKHLVRLQLNDSILYTAHV